jgi:hypothetical protein
MKFDKEPEAVLNCKEDVPPVESTSIIWLPDVLTERPVAVTVELNVAAPASDISRVRAEIALPPSIP